LSSPQGVWFNLIEVIIIHNLSFYYQSFNILYRVSRVTYILYRIKSIIPMAENQEDEWECYENGGIVLSALQLCKFNLEGILFDVTCLIFLISYIDELWNLDIYLKTIDKWKF